MVDLIKELVWQRCKNCFNITREDAEECYENIDRENQFCSRADRFDINDIHEGLREWLSSFDTNSATKCFEAVNILKMKIAQEEMHEADEKLLNSDWGKMEVQE